MVTIVLWLDLHLSMHTVPITTKVCESDICSHPCHTKVCESDNGSHMCHTKICESDIDSHPGHSVLAVASCTKYKFSL